MTTSLKIALAQLNPTVGDIAGNLAKARRARADAAGQGAEIVLFSELFICGYPPEDLVLKPALQDEARAAVAALGQETVSGPAVLIGTPWVEAEKLYNAFAYLDGGAVKSLRYKVDLPNYGVFDEKRVFTPGPMPGPITARGVRIGVPICEDVWQADVVECIAETGGEFILVPNGSPFEAAKEETRLNIGVNRVVESGLPFAYLNQIGGQDELVFDGGSFVLNADRSLAVQLPAWEEALVVTDWRKHGDKWRCESGLQATLPTGLEAIYHAMMLGLRDYVRKNRFPDVVLGLSGGIDSALTAAVAADALGPDKVRCVMMPSRYTSQESLDDAAEVARLLGTRLDTVTIEDAVKAFGAMTAPLFAGRAP